MTVVPKFLVYVMVGSVSAIIDLLTLSMLISVNTQEWLAVSIAFIAGFVFNVKAHSLFTFTSPLTRISGIRFTAVAAINYLLTLAIIETLTSSSFSLITAKVVSLPIIAASGYLLGRHWAFKS
jgi:putative flippase GtrA